MNILSVIPSLRGSLNEPAFVKAPFLKVLLNKTDKWKKEVKNNAQFYT